MIKVLDDQSTLGVSASRPNEQPLSDVSRDGSRIPRSKVVVGVGDDPVGCQLITLQKNSKTHVIKKILTREEGGLSLVFQN